MLWGADRAGVGDEVGARLDLEVELAPVLRRELLEHLFRVWGLGIGIWGFGIWGLGVGFVFPQ